MVQALSPLLGFLAQDLQCHHPFFVEWANPGAAQLAEVGAATERCADILDQCAYIGAL